MRNDQGESTSEIPYEERGFAFAVACNALGVCPNTGLKLVRDGKLQSYRVGRRHLVTGRAVRECQTLLAYENVAR